MVPGADPRGPPGSPGGVLTPATVSGVDEAAALGLSALAQVLARTGDGVTVIDSAHRWVYANPAACRMLGRPLEQLRGRNFLDSVRPGAHPFVLSHFADRRRGGMPLATGLLVGPDASEREVVYFTFAAEMAGAVHTVAVFRDLTAPRSAARAAAALAQTATQMAGPATTNEVLAGIARHAVDGTRALSAGISVLGEDHKLGVGGSYGAGGPSHLAAGPAWAALNDAPGADVIAALSAGSIIVGRRPGKAVVLADARADWAANPITRGFAESMRDDDWRGAICVPMAWQDQVIGLLGVYLPATLDSPDESELAFCSALADQAALAVANARLSSEAGHAAALEERSRLARELHDSVSQALFSMTMHARAAELSIGKSGLDPDAPLARSVAQLAGLARGTLAEMRALIFELRPESLVEEGLTGALRKQAAALSAREQVAITVQGPPHRLELDPDVEEHLYRIVSEAVHNTVKHAHAARASVTVTAGRERLRVTVSDDGTGFDTSAVPVGHLGLSTMAQRAETIGATLAVIGHPGTTVMVTVPVDARSSSRP